jgi:hypothetical protein
MKTFLPICLFASFCHLGDARSASPRDELLRLVPSDAGFCVVVQGLRDQVERLQKSPFAARVAASPYGQALRESDELRKFAGLDVQLRIHLNISWVQLRDDILGDAVILAYSPGPPDRPQAEIGLLLLHARRPDVLAGLLDRLNTSQQKAGELAAVERRTHNGQTYFMRRKTAGEEEFYFQHDSVLAFTDKEVALRAAIDRDRSAKNVDSNALADRLRSMGMERDFVVWWVNPRAFDASIAAKVASAHGAEAAFLRTFERYWKTLEGAAVSMVLSRDLSLNFAVQARMEALPAAARRVMAEAARPSHLWSTFPDNALFAAAGRISLEPAVEAGADFVAADNRREIQDAVERTVGAILGRDILSQILRHLGPDWGVCVTPPETGDKGWLPSLTGMLRLRPGGEGGVQVEQRALDGLDFVARLAVLGYNSQRLGQIRLRMERQEGVEVRVIEGAQLPPGLQPAFAWKGGYLVLASNPEAVRRFTPPTEAPTADSLDAEVPRVRMALQGWAAYLRAYRQPLAAYLASGYHLSPAEADARIDRVVNALDLFDAVEVVQRTAPGRVTFTIRLKTLPHDN